MGFAKLCALLTNHLALLALVTVGSVLCALFARYALVGIAKVLVVVGRCTACCVCQTVKCMLAVSCWLLKGLVVVLRCMIISVTTGITIATCAFAYALTLILAMKVSQFIVF